MARPGVAKRQRQRQAFDRGIRFVDDDRRPIRPVAEPVGHGILQRDVAVQRLLDKKQVLEEGGQLRVGGETRPMVAKIVHGLELLITVEAELVVTRRVLPDCGSNTAQALVIGVEVAVDFDFEMAQAVGANALVERLRKRVVEQLIGRDGGGGQRIGQANRVSGEHLDQRLLREQLSGGALGQGSVNRTGLKAQRVAAQRLGKRLARGAANRLDQCALHQGRAKVSQQRRDVLGIGPSGLLPVNRPPSGEGSRSLDAERIGHGSADHPEHVGDFLLERVVRHLGEPLRWQQVGGNAPRRPPIHLGLDPDKHHRHLSHGGDAVLERHARLELSLPDGGSGDFQQHGEVIIRSGPLFKFSGRMRAGHGFHG